MRIFIDLIINQFNIRTYINNFIISLKIIYLKNKNMLKLYYLNLFHDMQSPHF